jgi:hypothetical protein
VASHALGYQQLTVSNAALNLPSIPAGTSKVALRAETQNIRWRDDGSDPTAGAGVLMTTTDPILVYDGEITKVRVIRATGADGVLNIAYYA